MWLISATVIIQYRKQIGIILYRALLIFSLAAVAASVLQFFFYGISLTNIALAVLTVVLRLKEIVNTNHSLASFGKYRK